MVNPVRGVHAVLPEDAIVDRGHAASLSLPLA
jgi:hypothetical protein